MTDRREFLKSAGAAALTTSLFTGKVRGANDRIAAAFIGIGRDPDGHFDPAALENAIQHGFRIVRWHPEAA